MSPSCDCEGERKVLVYACSGAANVAEIADRAARKLASEGKAAMFCLAAFGAGIEPMIDAARNVNLNVVIDGCPMDCGRKIFDKAGLKNYVQIRVTDLGIDETDGAAVTEEQVAVTVVKAAEAIDKA